MLLNYGVGEHSWESLEQQEIKSVNPKGNQSWIFIGRTDAETETPIFWRPDVKRWLIWKDPDVGKDWRQEERGTTEDEIVGWHHRFNGHEFEQTLGDSKGQEAQCAVVHRVAKSRTPLSDWTTSSLEKSLFRSSAYFLIGLFSVCFFVFCYIELFAYFGD